MEVLKSRGLPAAALSDLKPCELKACDVRGKGQIRFVSRLDCPSHALREINSCGFLGTTVVRPLE